MTIKEKKKPLTVKELIPSDDKYWTELKVQRYLRKAIDEELFDRIRVASERSRGSPYAYYPTKKFEKFYNNFVFRKLTNQQLEKVPDELKDVLK